MVSLVHTRIHRNHAVVQGGGVRIHDGELELVDSRVSDNTVGRASGGSIHATLAHVSVLRGVVSGHGLAQDDLGAVACGDLFLGARASFAQADTLGDVASAPTLVGWRR